MAPRGCSVPACGISLGGRGRAAPPTGERIKVRGRGKTHELRFRSRRRPAAHREREVEQISARRAAPLGGRHGLSLAGARDPRSRRARAARLLRLWRGPRGLAATRGLLRATVEALWLAGLP